MKSFKFIVFACLLPTWISTVNAQTFNWRQDGYFNHSSGGFYKNIDGSGIDLKIEGLVNDESSGENIKTGRNDQQAQKQIHSYVFTFSENVDIEFTISEINLDTVKSCFDDELVFTGNPYIINSNKLHIYGDTLVKPINKSYVVHGAFVTIQYHNINQFTIRHGSGTFCNPGFITFSPIKFQKAQRLVQFGADTLHFENILFESDQKYLNEEYYASLDSAIQLMREDENVKVMLLGFADDQGSQDDNSKLSRKRVNAVLAYLLLKGVDRSRIEATYFGEQIPEKSNVNLYGQGQNRRVEIYIVH